MVERGVVVVVGGRRVGDGSPSERERGGRERERGDGGGWVVGEWEMGHHHTERKG